MFPEGDKNIDGLLRFFYYVRMARIHHRHRRRVLSLWGFKCGLCGKSGKLEIHHVTPQKKNGSSENGNLIPLCEACHFITLRSKCKIDFKSIIDGKNKNF